MAAINSIDLSEHIGLTEPPRPSGRALKPASDCQYRSQVKANDLLLVDFDVHAVRSDGLYLVEILTSDHRRIEWRGCRRFAKTASGVEMDMTGDGDWKIASLAEWRMRVVGLVDTVYRPI